MLTRVKSFFTGLFSASAKQIEVIILNSLYSLFNQAMYFLGFYLVFMFDPESSRESNISMILIIAFLLWVWATLNEIFKDYLAQNITPYKGALWRFLFDTRYIFLAVGFVWIFNLVYNPKQIYIYAVIIIVSKLIAKLLIGRKLVLFEKDWKEYEAERKR